MNTRPLGSTNLPPTAARGGPSTVHPGVAFLALVAPLSVAALLGCTGPSETRGVAPDLVAAPEVPYVDAEGVDRLITGSEGPTLLEFCVPLGCFRCDAMRGSINALAQEEGDRLCVRRVNLAKEHRLAAEWGVKVCPTYVVLVGGNEVGRAEYPTSADLIAAMIPQQTLPGSINQPLN